MGGGDTRPLGETGAEVDVAFIEDDAAPVEGLADRDSELRVETASPASEERLLGDVGSAVDGDKDPSPRAAARCIRSVELGPEPLLLSPTVASPVCTSGTTFSLSSCSSMPLGPSRFVR